MIIKKGTKLRLPISEAIKYKGKIKTNKGFQQPLSYKEIRYAGPMLKIILDDTNNTNLDCIPEHECLIIKDGKLIECKAKDLQIGDLFENELKQQIKILDIKKYEYDGYVYSYHMKERAFYANGYLTHNCCRLRLDLKEVRKRGGGLFGSGEKTGSIGVVTINMPRIGYLSKTEDEFFQRLSHFMDLARKSLFIKRKELEKNYENGLYPYIKRYLSDFNSHFSTIGLVGMNEALLNFKPIKKDIGTKQGKEFAIKVLDFMNNKLSAYQEEDKTIMYNLEATPAESTAYRLAKHDKERFPDIITAGTISSPYYTNSTNLPVGYTSDPWEAIRNQESIQKKFSGGCVWHCYLGENIDDWKKTRDFVKKVIYNSELPYITISPYFSHCAKHGALKGDTHGICPYCLAEQTEQYEKKKIKLLLQVEELKKAGARGVNLSL